MKKDGYDEGTASPETTEQQTQRRKRAWAAFHTVGDASQSALMGIRNQDRDTCQRSLQRLAEARALIEREMELMP